MSIEVFNSYCSVCQANTEAAHLSTVDNSRGLNGAANSPTGGVDTVKNELVQISTSLEFEQDDYYGAIGSLSG